jgi:hypothetical protein
LQPRGSCGFLFLLAAQAEVFSKRSLFELIENESGRNVSSILGFENSKAEIELALHLLLFLSANVLRRRREESSRHQTGKLGK